MSLDLPKSDLIAASDKTWFETNMSTNLDASPRFGTMETQQMASVDATDSVNNIVWKDWMITGSTTLLAAAGAATAAVLSF